MRQAQVHVPESDPRRDAVAGRVDASMEPMEDDISMI